MCSDDTILIRMAGFRCPMSSIFPWSSASYDTDNQESHTGITQTGVAKSSSTE